MVIQHVVVSLPSHSRSDFLKLLLQMQSNLHKHFSIQDGLSSIIGKLLGSLNDDIYNELCLLSLPNADLLYKDEIKLQSAVKLLSHLPLKHFNKNIINRYTAQIYIYICIYIYIYIIF